MFPRLHYRLTWIYVARETNLVRGTITHVALYKDSLEQIRIISTGRLTYQTTQNLALIPLYNRPTIQA